MALACSSVLESQRIDVSSQCVWYVIVFVMSVRFLVESVTDLFLRRCIFKTYIRTEAVFSESVRYKQRLVHITPKHRETASLTPVAVRQQLLYCTNNSFPNTDRIKTASLWDWESTWTVISPNLSSTQIGQIWDQSCSINLNRFRFIDPESKNIEKWQPKKLRYLQQFTPLRCRITLEEHFGKNSL